jgi:TM2 domain-containing membrane protein YozV
MNQTVKPRNPVLAALGSLTVPGLGQLYNGQPKLALVWLGTYFTVSLLYLLRLLEFLAAPAPSQAIPRSLGWLGVLVLIWLGGVVQAVFTALDRQDYALQPYNRGLVYLGMYLACYLVLPLLFAFPLVRRTMIAQGAVTPEQQAQWLDRLRGSGTPAPTSGLQAVPRDVGRPLSIPVDIPNPDSAAAGAATVVHVVLVGGPDGGIYDAASAHPVCTHQAGAAPSWAGLFTAKADSAGMTAIQFRIPIDQGETNDFQLSVNLGNVPTGRSYVVDGRPPRGESRRGTASVQRRGDGVVLRMTASTAQGVRVEATVQCRVVG